MRLLPPISVRVDDEKTDRVLRNQTERISELQKIDILRGNVIKDIELEASTETPVPHGLGRRATVFVSPVRGASSTGRIEEVRDSSDYDPTKYVVLNAVGYGATITVDLWVF